jgi:hypothetical protein
VAVVAVLLLLVVVVIGALVVVVVVVALADSTPAALFVLTILVIFVCFLATTGVGTETGFCWEVKAPLVLVLVGATEIATGLFEVFLLPPLVTFEAAVVISFLAVFLRASVHPASSLVLLLKLFQEFEYWCHNSASSALSEETLRPSIVILALEELLPAIESVEVAIVVVVVLLV